MLLHDKWYHVTFVITRFYLPLLSTNVKHPKFGFHVTSLCQGLRRSAGSEGCSFSTYFTLSYKHQCYIEFLATEKNRIQTHVKNTIFFTCENIIFTSQ